MIIIILTFQITQTLLIKNNTIHQVHCAVYFVFEKNIIRNQTNSEKMNKISQGMANEGS